MKRVNLLLIAAISILFTACQSQKDPAQIAAEKAYEEYLSENAISSLEKNEFVLEANRVLFKYGNYVNVNSSTNFIKLKDNKATIQLAFNSPFAGPNGIGGITLDGNVSNIKYSKSKKGEVFFSMNVQGVAVSAVVSVSMIAGSNYCTATVMPTFSGNRITFSGYLYSVEDSNIYKGQSL